MMPLDMACAQPVVANKSENKSTWQTSLTTCGTIAESLCSGGTKSQAVTTCCSIRFDVSVCCLTFWIPLMFALELRCLVAVCALEGRAELWGRHSGRLQSEAYLQ